jgi:signal transduction histidine kinase
VQTRTIDGAPEPLLDLDTLEVVMDTIDEFIVLFQEGPPGTFRATFANQSFLRVCATGADVVGGDAEAIMVPYLADQMKAHMVDLADGPVRYRDHLPLADGSAVELDVTLTVPGGGGGQLLWVGHDVTERRRNERAVARIREELERSNRDLDAFATIASHDLQEPLRMVASYVELLSRRYSGELDERAQTYIGYALEGAHRMRGLIDALLDYGRLRKAPRHVEEVALDGVVAQVVEDAASRIGEASAVIDVGPLPTVPGDVGELTRLLQNLVTNALKFRRDAPPEIRVRATAAPTEWCITIDDNGIGVPEHQRDRMFEMFGRGHSRTEFPGHGVGLAVCRSIVNRHGGRIWLEESPAGGARVAFTLPTTPPEDIL